MTTIDHPCVLADAEIQYDSATQPYAASFPGERQLVFRHGETCVDLTVQPECLDGRPVIGQALRFDSGEPFVGADVQIRDRTGRVLDTRHTDRFGEFAFLVRDWDGGSIRVELGTLTLCCHVAIEPTPEFAELA